MTPHRKKVKKLLMSRGMSRNFAESASRILAHYANHADSNRVKIYPIPKDAPGSRFGTVRE